MNKTKPTPEQIQNVVMEVMDKSFYLKGKKRYWTDYFCKKDRKNFDTCIYSDGNEMETFLEYVRKDSEKYLILHPELISEFTKEKTND